MPHALANLPARDGDPLDGAVFPDAPPPLGNAISARLIGGIEVRREEGERWIGDHRAQD